MGNSTIVPQVFNVEPRDIAVLNAAMSVFTTPLKKPGNENNYYQSIFDGFHDFLNTAGGRQNRGREKNKVILLELFSCDSMKKYIVQPYRNYNVNFKIKEDSIQIYYKKIRDTETRLKQKEDDKVLKLLGQKIREKVLAEMKTDQERVQQELQQFISKVSQMQQGADPYIEFHIEKLKEEIARLEPKAPTYEAEEKWEPSFAEYEERMRKHSLYAKKLKLQKPQDYAPHEQNECFNFNGNNADGSFEITFKKQAIQQDQEQKATSTEDVVEKIVTADDTEKNSPIYLDAVKEECKSMFTTFYTANYDCKHLDTNVEWYMLFAFMFMRHDKYVKNPKRLINVIRRNKVFYLAYFYIFLLCFLSEQYDTLFYEFKDSLGSTVATLENSLMHLQYKSLQDKRNNIVKDNVEESRTFMERLLDITEIRDQERSIVQALDTIVRTMKNYMMQNFYTVSSEYSLRVGGYPDLGSEVGIEDYQKRINGR